MRQVRCAREVSHWQDPGVTPQCEPHVSNVGVRAFFQLQPSAPSSTPPPLSQPLRSGGSGFTTHASSPQPAPSMHPSSSSNTLLFTKLSPLIHGQLFKHPARHRHRRVGPSAVFSYWSTVGPHVAGQEGNHSACQVKHLDFAEGGGVGEKHDADTANRHSFRAPSPTPSQSM